MDNILIIALGENSDFLNVAPYISRLKHKNPRSRISILTFQENAQLCSILSGISSSFFINRSKIKSLNASLIYSQAFGLNEFLNPFKEISKTSWTNVLDLLPTQVSQLIKESLIEEHKINTKSSYSINYLNIVRQLSPSPIHSTDAIILSQEGSNEYTEHLETPISSIAKYNEIAFTNFNKIRNVSTNGLNKKIIGINLNLNSKQDEFKTSLLRTVNLILNSNHYFPVLIGSPEIKNFASEICKAFDNKPIFIEASLETLPSVLVNLDGFVSISSSIYAQMAALLETPTITLFKNQEKLFNGLSYGNGHIRLAPYHATNEIEENIIAALDATFNDLKVAFKCFSYETKVEAGYGLALIKKDSNISYLDQKYLFWKNAINKIQNKEFTFTQYSNSFKNQKWVDAEKEAITNLTKNLLNTLRTLVHSKENQKMGKLFAQSLNKLLSHTNSTNLDKLPALMFQEQIEAYSSSNSEDGVKLFEKARFKLKEDIKILLLTLKDEGLTKIPERVSRPSI